MLLFHEELVNPSGNGRKLCCSHLLSVAPRNQLWVLLQLWLKRRPQLVFQHILDIPTSKPTHTDQHIQWDLLFPQKWRPFNNLILNLSKQSIRCGHVRVWVSVCLPAYLPACSLPISLLFPLSEHCSFSSAFLACSVSAASSYPPPPTPVPGVQMGFQWKTPGLCFNLWPRLVFCPPHIRLHPCLCDTRRRRGRQV